MQNGKNDDLYTQSLDFFSLDTLTVSSSGTPSYIANNLSACSASAFLAIGYTSEQYVPLDNTCAYQCPSKEFTHPSMVYVDDMPVRLLVWETLFTLYRLTRGIADERVSLCVVLAIFSLTC